MSLHSPTTPRHTPTEAAPDIYTPVQNRWQTYSGRLRELQSLLDEQAALNPHSAARHANIRAIEDELGQTQNELHSQTGRVKQCENEVSELQNSLEQSKSKLSTEQNHLRLIQQKQIEQQKDLEKLTDLGTRVQELEGLLAAKKTEVDRLSQELQGSMNKVTQIPQPSVARSPGAEIENHGHILASDLPQTNSPLHPETQVRTNDVFDIQPSEEENENVPDIAFIFDAVGYEPELYEPEAADDSDYTDHQRSPSSGRNHAIKKQRKVKRRTTCIRCREHRYECMRRGGPDGRFCVRCVEDKVPCSYRRASTQRRPGRKRNDSLDERLGKLVDVQNIPIPEIQKRGLLGETTVAALKARYRRFKLREVQQEPDGGAETV